MKRCKNLWWLLFLAVTIISISGCSEETANTINSYLNESTETSTQTAVTTTMDLPTEYDGTNQEIVINENVPTFTETDLDLPKGVWQTFSDLDNLNRVGVANALIGSESFPTEERQPLNVKPTGWNQKKLADG